MKSNSVGTRLAQNPEVRSSGTKAKCNLVFPTRNGRVNIKLLDQCKLAARRAGLEETKCKIKSFRATFATNRLRSGYDLATVLVGAVTWFLRMQFRRFAIVVAAGLIAVSFLIGSATIVPAFVLRRDLRKELRKAEAVIADFERTGRPEFINLPGAEMNNFVDLKQPGVRDFQLAVGYLSDIYTCRERGRISDDQMIDRYPEVPVHAAEAGHVPEPPGSWHPGANCLNDNSARQPWMSYRDLQAAALKRAKLYVRNAEIETGMIHGQRQLPELLGSAELVAVSPFARTDVPAHFSNIGSLVQIVRAGKQTQADTNSALEKQDTVATGTSSTATLVFADQTACTVQPGSQIMIEENSINASGRTFVKVELVQGKIGMQSARQIYRSSLQVEFVTVKGTVNIDPESSIEVQSDPATSIGQVLLRNGAAEVRLVGEPPVKLAEPERFIFANNGQRITTQDTAAPELLMSQGSR